MERLVPSRDNPRRIEGGARSGPIDSIGPIKSATLHCGHQHGGGEPFHASRGRVCGNRDDVALLIIVRFHEGQLEAYLMVPTRKDRGTGLVIKGQNLLSDPLYPRLVSILYCLEFEGHVDRWRSAHIFSTQDQGDRWGLAIAVVMNDGFRVGCGYFDPRSRLDAGDCHCVGRCLCTGGCGFDCCAICAELTVEKHETEAVHCNGGPSRPSCPSSPMHGRHISPHRRHLRRFGKALAPRPHQTTLALRL